jgi:hypothetical protein
MISPGDIIAGRYRVVRQLGQGSFGTTYLAEHVALGQLVVVKVALQAAGEADAGWMRRETRVLASLTHPNIARLYDFGATEDGRFYIVIEWVQGRSLSDIIAAYGPLSPRAALEVFSAVAGALAEVHRRQLIHRDLKPSNIIVPDGRDFSRAMLIDFGAFGELREELGGMTRAGQIAGTPNYMAPEQLTGEPQSTATDVFGMGVLLYEMLYGQPPFKADTLSELIQNLLRGEVTLPPAPPLPAALSNLIRRSLSKDPTLRPQTAADVLLELRAIRGAEETARDAPPVQQGASAPPVSAGREAEVRMSLEEAERRSYETAERRRYESPTTTRAGWPEMTEQRSPMPADWSYAPARGLRLGRRLLRLLGLVAFVLVVGVLAWPLREYPLRALGVAGGVLLAAVGVVLSLLLPRWIRRRRSEVEREASRVLLGSRSRELLTASLMIEVERLLENLNLMGDRLMTSTLMIMVHELRDARSSRDRQAALMNIITILEKLTYRMSPWYVRHEKLVAFLVAAVGVAAGLASIVASVKQVESLSK